MISIINDRIDSYLDSLSHDPDPLLAAMEEQAHREDFPIVDRQVGRLLHVIASLMQPSLVVELGSGFGYSAYCFATAMQTGKVVLTDYDEAHLEQARKLFTEKGILKKGEFRLGDALKSAKSYDNIDILFIDVEKDRYLESVKEMYPYLRKGGVVIADNTLWGGRVVEANPDQETRGILEFNEFMFHSGYFYSVNLPLRDGVILGIKN